MEKRKNTRDSVAPTGRVLKTLKSAEKTVCINTDCKLRKAGCKGAQGCPGYKAG